MHKKLVGTACMKDGKDRQVRRVKRTAAGKGLALACCGAMGSKRAMEESAVDIVSINT